MGDSDLEEVFEIMADDCAREILARTSQQPMSAPELVEACNVSERTIYRRLERLQSLGLTTESMEIDPDGHHRAVYDTVLEAVQIELEDGEYEIRLDIKEDTAERFARMWKDIRDE